MNAGTLVTAACGLACIIVGSLGFAAANETEAVLRESAEQPERRDKAVRESRARRNLMEATDLPEPSVEITVEGTTRVITANGIPGHDTGDFPNGSNPNAIRAQSRTIRLPTKPTIATEPVAARPEFGIALNGVIFDSSTGEFWTPERDRAFGGGSDWNYEAIGGSVNLGLDGNNAHVQPSGKYHYHGVPTGLLTELSQSNEAETMIQLGWAFDGYPIYSALGHKDPDDPDSPLVPLTPSYRLKDGERPKPPAGPGDSFDGSFGNDYEFVECLGDLDEFNGRSGVTPEFPRGTYYYVITDSFPYVPRMWRGEPAENALRRGPGGAGGDGQRERRRPARSDQRRRR